MFSTSSQKQNWIFSDENEISSLKEEVNASFISVHGSKIPVGSTSSLSLSKSNSYSNSYAHYIS